MLPQIRVDEGLPLSGPFSIQPLSFEAACFVAWRMRDIDRREISSTMKLLAPDEFAKNFTNICKFGFVVVGVNPIAVFGINEVWPGRFEAMMFATNDWPHVALSAAREIKRVLIPKIKAAGLKLGFCFVEATNKQALRWAKYLGFSEQTEIAAWGKNDENVKLMIWRP